MGRNHRIMWWEREGVGEGGVLERVAPKKKLSTRQDAPPPKNTPKKDGTAARISKSPALKVDVHGASAWLRNTIEFLHTC